MKGLRDLLGVRSNQDTGLWLARQMTEHTSDPYYMLFNHKPRKHPIHGWITEHEKNKYRIDCFCAEEFEKATGYRLEPGGCKQVRIAVEDV